MGLFDKFRKKEETVEKPKERWDEAFQANPMSYQAKDGSPMISFTLTENTDTILPMDPKKMYRIGRKEIDDFRLGFMSLTEDKLIGVLPFYSCINVLSNYVAEIRKPQVLIRKLSNEELYSIVNEVKKNMADWEHLNKAFEKNLKFMALDRTDKETVERIFNGKGVRNFTFENVSFPSGTIIAADPICYLRDPKLVACLHTQIPAGTYPITISVIQNDVLGVRIAGMKLKVCSKEAASYTPAMSYFLEKNARKDATGYPVETGTATFCDMEAAKAYWRFLKKWYAEHPGGNIYDDYLADFFNESYKKYPDLQREDGDFIRFLVPDSGEEIVMAATGFGDGYYSVFWGYDENGVPVELVTMFIDPELFCQKEE